MSVTGEVIVNGVKVGSIQGDITQQMTEAIVNAANPSLMGGGGVDGAIHRSGGPAILNECCKIISRIGRLDTGRAVITTGGNLKAKYVIHTVGPIWHGGGHGEDKLLTSAYLECLKLATAYKLRSLTFPSISTGAYGYPLAEAARVAINTVMAFLRENPTSLEKVVFVLYDSKAYQTYSAILTDSAG